MTLQLNSGGRWSCNEGPCMRSMWLSRSRSIQGTITQHYTAVGDHVAFVAPTDEPGSPTSQGGGGSWHVGEFEDVCLSILTEKLWPMFGKSVIYFDHPVETNVVPDYYHVRSWFCAAAVQDACAVLLSEASQHHRKLNRLLHAMAADAGGAGRAGRHCPRWCQRACTVRDSVYTFQVIPRDQARDLGTMKTKLMRRRYKSPQAFFDVSARSCCLLRPAVLQCCPCCRRALRTWLLPGVIFMD